MPEFERYRIVPEASTVTIVGETSLYPIVVNVTPSGWMEAAVADGEFVPGTDIRAEVEIAVIEFRSGNPLVDRETRRRLRANQYPTISGTVREVVKIDGPDATVKGMVTFLGRDVEQEGVVHLRDSGDESVSLTGRGQMDVQWWGLEPPTLLVLKMDPVVTVSIDLVFRPVDRL